MANKIHVKKNDTVVVLSGKDKGKKGKIIHVDPKKTRVIVEGVNFQTKHKKARSQQKQAGRFEQEGSIHASNVLLFCDKCDKPTRVGKRYLETGSKVRFCKKCDEVVDIIKEKE